MLKLDTFLDFCCSRCSHPTVKVASTSYPEFDCLILAIGLPGTEKQVGSSGAYQNIVYSRRLCKHKNYDYVTVM